MSNAILKRGEQIFGMRKPSKFNDPVKNKRAKELTVQYREAVSHWNIAGLPRNPILVPYTCRALMYRAQGAFRNEIIIIHLGMKLLLLLSM